MRSEPGAVVLRSGRGDAVVVLAAVGFVEAGLLAGMVTSLRDGRGFTVDGREVGVVGNLTAWSLLGLLALLLGAALVLAASALVRPETVVLSPAGYRRERRGSATVSLSPHELTGVRFRPAARATWSRTDRQDSSVAGVGRRRLHNRIELRAPQATVELTDSQAWPSIVGIVRDWVREQPHLVDDPESRSFLLDPATAADGDRVESLPGWPVGLIALSVRRRDPWTPFLPDVYGRYSAMFSGRYTAVRAPERGSRLGLLARWGFLLLWFAPAVALVWLVVWVLLLLT